MAKGAKKMVNLRSDFLGNFGDNGQGHDHCSFGPFDQLLESHCNKIWRNGFEGHEWRWQECNTQCTKRNACCVEMIDICCFPTTYFCGNEACFIGFLKLCNDKEEPKLPPRTKKKRKPKQCIKNRLNVGHSSSYKVCTAFFDREFSSRSLNEVCCSCWGLGRTFLNFRLKMTRIYMNTMCSTLG